jgi:hypothetical protein
MNSLISLGLTAIVLMASSCNSAIALPSNPQSNKIATIKKAPVIGTIQSKLESGCGCYSYFANSPKNQQRAVFSYQFSGTPSESAIMNIDGQDIKLISKRKGAKIEKWVYNDITVTFTTSLVKKEYEGASFNEKIVVKRGGKSSIVRATGYCGC